MSGGFPDPGVRVHQQAGRYHVQAGEGEYWRSICTRERKDAADATREAIAAAMLANTDTVWDRKEREKREAEEQAEREREEEDSH